MSSGISSGNVVDIYSSDLSTTIGSITITGPLGVAVRKLGATYYAYIAAGGQVRRWDVTNPATPTLDASWSPPGTAGAEGLEVDTDGTVFVAGGGVVRRISPDGTSITHTYTLANASDVAIFRNKIYVIRTVNPAPPIVVLNKIDLTSGGADITVPELGAFTRGALSQFTAIDVSTDGKLFVSEENYTSGSNGIPSYTPPATSFNPTPGPITGRIYFDRVLISSTVEPTLITVNVTQPTCTLQSGTIVITATGDGVLEYSIDNGANWSTNNTFSGLSPSSNHTVLVRSQSAPSGITAYGSNPVAINAVPGFPTITNTNTGEQFCTIQAAIDDAQTLNGHTITVAAGTYNESINVNKSLIIKGAQADVCAATTRAGSESIINCVNGIGITADNVTINGFTIQGQTSSNASPGVGYAVYIAPPRAGTQLLNNIIKNNIIGSSLANTGASQAAIKCNWFDSNNNSGPSSGNGIYTDEYTGGGVVSNVLIENNKFSGNASAGLTISTSQAGSATTGITITKNEFSGNARAVFLYNTVSSSFTNNVISGSTRTDGTGDLRIYGGVNNLSVMNNSFSAGGPKGILITNDGAQVPATNSNITITQNSFTGYSGTNFAIDNVSGYIGTLPATCNWWGSASANSIASMLSSPASITYSPWLVGGGDGAGVGFQPTAACTGTPVVINSATATSPCTPGSIEVNFSGGTAPYAFSWTGGGSASGISSSPNSITNLAVGTYTVTITDANGSSVTSGSLTINTTPTITLGVVAALCKGTTSANLTYSATVGSPNQYMIDYDAAAEAAGFIDVAYTSLPLAQITLVIPANASGATYNAVLRVKNSTTGCISGAEAFTVIVNETTVGGSVGGSTAVCTGVNSTVLTLSGHEGDVIKWQSSTNAAFSSPTDITNTTATYTVTNITTPTYYRAVVQSGLCSPSNSSAAFIQIHTKPTITLNIFQQTLNEGNNQTLCDIDANPSNNTLASTITTNCLSGPVLWRTKIGAAAWSDWTETAPTSQPSDNTEYQYQASCNACPSTITNAISIKINYRASTPQNVSMVADGTTIQAGQSATLCDQDGNALVFNATCGAGEVLLYSVDGGDYSTTIPSQMVDGNFHNYRVRCRKSDGTPSCIETESAVMTLKLTTISITPTVSITPLNSCTASSTFTGSTTCGSFATLWYDATTNQVLPNLPTTPPTTTSSYYARCQNAEGCLSTPSNTVTYTVLPVNVAPIVTASAESVCTGTSVTLTTNCPAGASVLWNTSATDAVLTVAFNNAITQSYSAQCILGSGCQTPFSEPKSILWKSFEITLINIGQSQSAVKASNDKALWSSQLITKDGGPDLDFSNQGNPTIYFTENLNKTAPRYWTIHADACALGTNGSLTFDMRATPETGVVRSFNTHENNAPYFMYANREGWTELYAPNHPAYGFYQVNEAGGNIYDEGLPKGLYKLSVRYWDMKGWGSIYPATRQPQGNVLAYQEFWFRIVSKDGPGQGAARSAVSGQQLTDGDLSSNSTSFAQVMPNPVTKVMRLGIQGAKGQAVKAELVDVAGRSMLERRFVPETQSHQEEFEVEKLVEGIYFLRVTTPDKQATLKVVKW